ncbi:MAG: hypothetical protein U0797_25435 [Gemmataceae bacterium]
MGPLQDTGSRLMWIQRDGSSLRVRTPAKVNLFLEVLRRRPDGYHDLATLMVSVGLYDTLEFRESGTGEVRLGCDRPGLSTGPDNLVCRAAQLLRDRLGVRHGVDVRLASAFPWRPAWPAGPPTPPPPSPLNCLWRLGSARPAWRRWKRRGLGSDVLFFFHGPAAWCTGRGEVIETMRLGRPLDLGARLPDGRVVHSRRLPPLTPAESPIDGAAARRAAESGDIEVLERAYRLE